MKNKKNLLLCLFIVVVFRMITLNDKINPYAPLLTKKGIEEKDEGHFLRALKYFNKALYHDPNYANGIFQLISIEPDELKRRNLIHRLANSNDKHPKFNPVIFSLGMFYFKNESYELANYYFIKAIYNYSCYPLPNYYSGIAHFRLGNPDGVLKTYTKLNAIPGAFNPTPWIIKLKIETNIK